MLSLLKFFCRNILDTIVLNYFLIGGNIYENRLTAKELKISKYLKISPLVLPILYNFLCESQDLFRELSRDLFREIFPRNYQIFLKPKWLK